MKAQFEKIPSSLSNSFYAFKYENLHFDAPWHFHPEYELTYIVKGTGIRYVGNHIQEFNAGDFVLIGSNLPHCWKSDHQYKDTVKSIVIQWDNDLLGEGWLEKNEFKHIKILLQKSSKGIRFETINSKKTINTLTSILNKNGFEKMLLFLKLLEELSTLNTTKTLTSEGFSPKLNRKSNDRIDKVYDYVQENYSHKIVLSEVSNLVNMGDESFCRFFKKSLNKSFFTFVNEYRINLSCKLLIETNKQVSQIAYDCGYESLPFFYRQFQKFMNCSPLQFKKKYLKMLK
ncbi:AraC family transcriptional regulator [Algibacter mikhailovii]|uniref:AraC family transcriptional regulator n=1 Tax=Algibacter mikhailovii TaxID=425498 RepID=UPI0024952547|nr:AraC family transcriptional regulator [Algibacter mikhailovii]